MNTKVTNSKKLEVRDGFVFPVSKLSFLNNYFYSIVYFLTLGLVFTAAAQTPSGGWDSWTTNGTAGNNDYGNGVIRLLSDVNTGCAAAAVHETSSTYDPTLGNFSQCYQVFFGCPGNDNIGSDANGDGVAFSFWKGSYNINNGLACGGGLGYMGAIGNPPSGTTKMFTIEFDTYSSQGTSGFDANYGGGASGFNDEIAIQINNDASDVGRLTAVNAGNLEDGLEHAICISYNNSTHILTVTLDGVTYLSYNLTGSPYDLPTYFGAGGLNQTWSSGKFGATNPTTVSNGASIIANLGGVPLCPAGIEITSPSPGSTFSGCPVGPITINATPTPPAGNTTTYVEFFVDGVSIGTDNTANYSAVYNSPTTGNHSLTAVAHWSGGGTTTSPAISVAVGSSLNSTSTAPVLDGSIETLWNSYSAFNMGIGTSGADISGYFKVMYDNTYFYLLVDVTDDILTDGATDCIWTGDKIEVYFDINDNNLTSYGATDYEYGFSYNDPGVCARGGTNTTGVTFAQANKVGGYITEVRIPWTSLGLAGPPSNGTNVGFEVQVADGDDANESNREGKIRWADVADLAYTNPSVFGTLQASSCNPLPVSFISLTANWENGIAVINWNTAWEKNNKYFQVQRSVDASSWETIADVNGMGDSRDVNAYQYLDSEAPEGICYYRLIQVDHDGTKTQSNYVVLNSQVSLHVYPNPFQHELNISGISSPSQVSIMDIMGRVVYASEVQEDKMVKLPLTLSPGAYILTIKSNSEIFQQEILSR